VATDNTKDLLAELSEFFRSSATNVEWISDDLRAELNVSTGLESVVKAAIDEGRTVVIAGTAGSGKTHLLRTLGPQPRYDVISDLAAFEEGDWGTIFGNNKRVLVAGNEGAFLQGSRKNLSGFGKVVSLLHAIQKGADPKEAGPTVIDAAGFDPAGSKVIGKMLQLPILSKFAEQLPDVAASAWKMFTEERVRQRLAVLVEAASAESGSDGFTFRQLWQFLADLLEGGREKDEPWFARVFEGASEVSRRIAHTFSPISIPLPHIGNQLWHGDVIRLRGSFLEPALPILEKLSVEMVKEQTQDQRLAWFRVLRILAAFGLRTSPLDTMLDSGVDLWSKVRSRQALPLLQAINQYFAFGLIELGDDLELWLQHDTERRLVKPDVQISLGSAKSSDFAIRRSSVIANRPKGVEQVEGGRLLLVHNPSGATLSVTKDLIDGILRTRSHRTNERRDVEYDWRISRFFDQVAKTASRPDRLKAARFDFQARTGRLMAWQIGADRIRRVVA
jgi:hypothetical protein